jgi:hypothetical protein
MGTGRGGKERKKSFISWRATGKNLYRFNQEPAPHTKISWILEMGWGGGIFYLKISRVFSLLSPNYA